MLTFTVLSAFTHFILFNVMPLGDGLLFLVLHKLRLREVRYISGRTSKSQTQPDVSACPSVHFMLQNFSQSKEALDVPNF